MSEQEKERKGWFGDAYVHQPKNIGTAISNLLYLMTHPWQIHGSTDGGPWSLNPPLVYNSASSGDPRGDTGVIVFFVYKDGRAFRLWRGGDDETPVYEIRHTGPGKDQREEILSASEDFEEIMKALREIYDAHDDLPLASEHFPWRVPAREEADEEDEDADEDPPETAPEDEEARNEAG